jgi:hypothetical protein
MPAYVAVFNGHEVAFQAEQSRLSVVCPLQSNAERIVSRAGLTSNRKNPQSIDVRIEVVEAKEGRLVRRLVKTCKVTPPLARMTQVEFEQEVAELLAKVPDAWHVAIKSLAAGFAGGNREENAGAVATLVYELAPVIRSQTKS